MEEYIIRIIDKLFIIYFGFYFLIDLLLFAIFLFTFRKEQLAASTESLPKASIIVPAFNEEISIVNCVNTLSKIDYPEFEIIIVNDGSADQTLNVLLQNFEFADISFPKEKLIQTRELISAYRTKDGKLTLLNKKNGGKADSINAGINYSTGEMICTVDADSILESTSLKRVVGEFVNDQRVFVCGGQIAVANGVEIQEGRVINAGMPSNPLVLWQIVEYIKSFLVSRLGLSKLDSVLIMSGAFSVFRKADLVSVGGFLTSVNNSGYIVDIFEEPKSTVCEDMEIVVRLWRYFREIRRPAKAVYLSKPLCWTEVPENTKNIFRQRARWHLGLAETMSMHKGLIFDPKYRTTGLFAMPFYFFYELLSPLLKIVAILFLAYTAYIGLINIEWALLLLLFITASAAVIASTVTVYVEGWSKNQISGNRDALRYKTFGDWAKLILFSILSDYSYAFFRIAAQLKGLYDFSLKRSEWNKFDRKGLKTIESKI